jgi:hypothetical protein
MAWGLQSLAASCFVEAVIVSIDAWRFAAMASGDMTKDAMTKTKARLM